MNKIIIKNTITIILIVSLVLSLGGCGSENHKKQGSGLKLSTIYGAALGGALIGGIIGHQSDETSEGVTLGAVVLGVGEFLRQTDELARKQRRHEEEDGDVKKVIVEIHNENGSVTPVELEERSKL